MPVYVYTSWPEAELFVNGVSYGRMRKEPSPVSDGYVPADTARMAKGFQDENHEGRYRLMWNDVVYQPGELRVVAYDNCGKEVGEKVVKTAGKPHHLEISSGLGFIGKDEVPVLKADGKDLAYFTVKVVDKNGNLCPSDSRLVEFDVCGAASYRAAANGDPTCLDIFHEPRMHAFSGMLTVIVQAGEKGGEAVLTARSKGLKPARVAVKVE